MTNEYVAGLFDGEGCIYISKDLHCLQVSISQKTTGILKLLATKFGGKIRTKSKCHSCWQWRLTNKQEIIGFLQAIEPHVIIKKSDVAIAFEFLNTYEKSRGYRVLKGDDLEYRQNLKDRLHAYN